MDKFAVMGLGRFGAGLARALSAAGAEVIAIDRHTKPVESLRDLVTLAVKLDSTDEEAMRSQGVAEVNAGIVGIGEDFEASALTVSILKGFGIPYIVARAENAIQARILRSIGAHNIASPEEESAVRWGHRLQLPGLGQYVELGEDHSLISLAAPPTFVGKTLIELHLRSEFGVNLIAIERPAGGADAGLEQKARRATIVPSATTPIQAGDVLVLVGANDAFKALPRD